MLYAVPKTSPWALVLPSVPEDTWPVIVTVTVPARAGGARAAAKTHNNTMHFMRFINTLELQAALEFCPVGASAASHVLSSKQLLKASETALKASQQKLKRV